LYNFCRIWIRFQGHAQLIDIKIGVIFAKKMRNYWLRDTYISVFIKSGAYFEAISTKVSKAH
jgi:hypothetical protein